PVHCLRFTCPRLYFCSGRTGPSPVYTLPLHDALPISWQLTLLVWLCFVPLIIALPRFQRWLSAAYTRVRERTGDMLAAVSESVRSEEHTSELQSRENLVCRLLLEKKNETDVLEKNRQP